MEECVECPRCAGKGKVPISNPLTQTLEAIRKHPGVTTVRLMELIPKVKLTAMCNRLKDLEGLGLIYRVKKKHPTGGLYMECYQKENNNAG